MSLLPTPRVVGAELLKVRKRWLPYVLFLVMVIGVSIQVWLVGYASWLDERNDAGYGFGQEALRALALPWSLPALLNSGQFWGAILVGILTASAVATEHGWGTVRQALIRGQTRSQYLTTKLLVIAPIAAISLLVALGIGLGFSAITTALADRSVSFNIPGGGGPSVPEILLMILRAGYGILPYGLLAFCLAVIGRSTALGVGGILLFVFGESILIAVLGVVGGPAADVRGFFLGHNVVALLAANRIGSGPSGYSFAFRDSNPSPSELPDPAVAALVLALYCLVFLAVAYWVFQRRDLSA